MTHAERIEAGEDANPCCLQRFTVSYAYPVHFTRGALDPSNPVLAGAFAAGGGGRILAVIDEGVAARRPDLPEAVSAYAQAHGLELAAPSEILGGGEAIKEDGAAVRRLHERLWALGIDRHAFVLAIGGGALLDAVGFAAATAHRGVRLVRMPTTVLAQADSGVGVKNGINAFGAKNFVGVFAPPFAVVNDAAFLESLEDRDRRSGMAEAVKVALIRDGAFFAWLEGNAGALAAFRPAAVDHLVRRCAELHMAHIALGGDPFESGSARPLDFGHWAAHKLESLTGHALRHGEAVAIGIALDARYSARTGLLPAGAEERICALLERLGFRLWDEAVEAVGNGRPLLLDGLREFREHLGGELTVTLLAGIGRGVEVHDIDAAAMLEAVAWLKDRDARR